LGENFSGQLKNLLSYLLNYIINPAIHYYPSRIPILWLLFLFVLSCSSAGIPAYGQADSTVRAIEADLVYTALPWYNASGGLKTGFVYMDNADVTAKISLDQIFNMSNRLTLFAYGLGNHGGRATALMGDFQVASNIEATQTWRLFECWSQYNLFNDRLSVLVGLYDLNSEFDVLKPGTLFINSSFGIGDRKSVV
jgi:carbohydrate-selective porin OprB